MTPKHVSQAIWAIGRLRPSDPVLITEMADAASRLRLELNVCEIANIAWGLGKPDFDGPEVVSGLIRRVVASPDGLVERCTAQEATNMLYSLRKL